MVGISGSLSISYGPLSGSGSGSYLKDRVLSKYTATVVYTSHYTAYAHSVKVDAITIGPALATLDASLLANQYGTKFVDQVIYGATLDVAFTITSKEELDFKGSEAKIKGKVGIGPLSVSFTARFVEQKVSSS